METDALSMVPTSAVLHDDVCALIDLATSPNTKKALRSDLNMYYRWCSANDKPTIPASPEQCAEYAAYMSTCGKKTSTIIRAISSLSRVHKMRGLESPAQTEIVRAVLKGIKRSNIADKKQAPPLSPTDLIKCLKSLSTTSWPGMRNRAILTIGWLGALRVSEISALDYDDIKIENEGFVILISKSKTDQEQRGYKLAIPNSPLNDVVEKWMDRISAIYQNENGPLFPAFRKHEEWFPRVGTRKRVSVRGMSNIIKRSFRGSGLRGYSCHSLRSGMITWSARHGVDERHIQKHSRHRSTNILREYIRDGELFLDHPLSPILDAFTSEFEHI